MYAYGYVMWVYRILSMTAENTVNMKIETGSGTISLVSLIAILSISLVVNLPGLAISPVMGKLTHIFPTASQLEIQLLTVLPNLFIIPFVLLSGRLSVSSGKIKLIVLGLLIYLTSGALYFFADSMWQLIAISSLLGVGCGILIPLAAGLIADRFTGKYRMKQLGIKSGIANISLVGATLLVGILANYGWRLPFVVYLLPIIPLMLSWFIGSGNEGSVPQDENEYQLDSEKSSPQTIKKLLGVTGLYGFYTYTVVIISYYLPFIVQLRHIDSSSLGVITSMFFLSIVVPGFFLTSIIKVFKQRSVLISSVSLALGIIVVILASHTWHYIAAMIFMGFGYGVVQPIVYDKASLIAPKSKVTLFLSIVLAVNYVSVSASPFIIDMFKKLFGSESPLFPFVFNLVLMGCFIVYALIFRNKFIFIIDKEYV